MFEEFEPKKQLSKATKKIYKSALNQLSDFGFETREDLIKKQKKVIALVNGLVEGDDDPARHKKRVFYSAIFYALHDKPLSDKKKYYDAFQTVKQNYGKE